MKLKPTFLVAFITLAIPTLFVSSDALAQVTPDSVIKPSKVFFTSNFDPDMLIQLFEATGAQPNGRVAVKISTGESQNTHYLDPQLIRGLVRQLDGTFVECNTAYKGNRYDSSDHYSAFEERGFGIAGPLEILDETGYMDLPVCDSTWIKFNRVGIALKDFDYLVNLAHFKGHQMGGFGGVLKNQSIGIASRDGKAYIHTAGAHDKADGNAFNNPHGQDAFLESMAVAAKSVHDYFNGKVVYIDIMNNLSVDCDCNGNPAEPQMQDIGMLASLDPVALDKACVDLVFKHKAEEGDNPEPLKERIRQMHGTHILEHAEKIGLGTTQYQLIDIDDPNWVYYVED